MKEAEMMEEVETCYCNHPSLSCPILSHPQKVLDHGYVKLIEAWGSDERVIESARMSTGKGFLGWSGSISCPKEDCGWKVADAATVSFDAKDLGGVCPRCGNSGLVTKPGDEKLLRYLYENAHATPFEFGGMAIEVQAPIFVFREWHRHRTQSYNEMSARYTPLPDLNYIPTIERLMLNSKTNKQAGTIAGAEELTEHNARDFQLGLEMAYEADEKLYQQALKMGVPKELARIHLPVGRYSRMRAHTNLRNWLAFLTLRQAPNAQWEIRQYANVVGTMIANSFPRTWALFDERRPK